MNGPDEQVTEDKSLLTLYFLFRFSHFLEAWAGVTTLSKFISFNTNLVKKHSNTHVSMRDRLQRHRQQQRGTGLLGILTQNPE